MLTNANLSELLWRAAEAADADHRQRALRRAARAALMWREEAETLAERGSALRTLPAVGPWIERTILEWLEAPPSVPEPAPLRRGFLTMAEVRATLATSPEWEREIRGDLQMHTTYSDGRASLETMAGVAMARGYAFVAVTDHSKGLPIARGMPEERLLEQGEEIGRLNGSFRAQGASFRLLRSIEMNLSPEGAGDMDEEVLAGLDLVLGAFHSKLRVAEDQTERYLAALANPAVHVLAHPRGRRYGVRAGLRADWERVAAEAARLDKALEVDAFPDRQDLDVETLRLVAEAGGRVSIGTDAHHPLELDHMPFGLATAIRAGVSRERILNFMPRAELLAWAGEVARPSV